jgi:SsrA-binding protein
MDHAINKRAHFDYEILKKYEAGIVLHGHEVKAIKVGKMSLAGSHVIIRDEEAWLLNTNIQPYQEKNTSPDYDISRTRKLLLNKKELSHLSGKLKERGLTIIPLRCYSKGGRIKLEIALAQSRKKYDKREVIKKRDAEREMHRMKRN